MRKVGGGNVYALNYVRIGKESALDRRQWLRSSLAASMAPVINHSGAATQVGSLVVLDDFVKFDGTDETLRVQAAVDSLAEGDTLIQRSTKKAMVSLVEFYCNNTTYRNIRLQTVADSPLFSTPFTVTSFGNYPDHNGRGLTFERCYVDGNRANHALAQGDAEDGGRSGFRIERGCRDISLVNCTGEYNCTDGLILFFGLRKRQRRLHGFPADAPDIDGVRVHACSWQWNRRHGGSAFRVHALRSTATKWNNNGRDLRGAADTGANHGLRATRLRNAPEPYGNGIDLEQESMVGFMSQQLSFDGDEFLDNARSGALHLMKGSRSAKGYRPVTGLNFVRCKISVGVSAYSKRYEAPLQITTFKSKPALGDLPEAEKISIKDCDFVIPDDATSTAVAAFRQVRNAVMVNCRVVRPDGSVPARQFYVFYQGCYDSDFRGNHWKSRKPPQGTNIGNQNCKADT
jgi:hypothetical protein